MKKGTASDMLNPANWFEDVVNCDGSNSTVLSYQSCLIPMATLRVSPYFYTLNDNIRVRIWAENLEGINAYADLALT